MRVKGVVCLIAFLSLCVPRLKAQETSSKVNIFAGYSYVQSNPSTSSFDTFHLNGGSVSGAYNVTNWLAGVADFGGYANGNIGRSGASATLSTYLFGPRVSYRHFRRITPFGQVLFGAGRTNATAFGNGESEKAFAMTTGGGVDYKFTQHWSVRPVQVCRWNTC